MKTKIILGFLAVALSASCTKDTAETAPFRVPEPFVGIADGEVILPAMTQDTTLVVRSNIWWLSSEPSAEWCRMQIDGDVRIGETPVRFLLDPNLTQQTRYATIAVRADGKLDYTGEIVVAQHPAAAFAVSADIEGMLAPDGTIHCAVLAATLQAKVTSNSAWTATCDQEWCTFGERSESQMSGSGADFPLVLNIADNGTREVRYATITLTSDDDPDLKLLEFRIMQAEDFPQASVMLANDDKGLHVSWSEVMGAVKYQLVVSANGAILATLDCGTLRSVDLTDFETATGCVDYVGDISVRIRAEAANPEVYSESDVVTGHSHFASGCGDGEDRYVIGCLRHLNNINKVLAKAQGYHYYCLAVDLDFAGTPFVPIGTMTTPFIGDFDGNGRTVSGGAGRLTASDSCYALFGCVESGDGVVSKIASLTFSGCTVGMPANNNLPNGSAVAHCVAVNRGGEIRGIMISNCNLPLVTGNTAKNQLAMAGVVGWNRAASDGTSGVVAGCATSGGYVGFSNVQSTFSGFNGNNIWYLGGVVGYNDAECRVEHCDNAGTKVHGRVTAGGVVASNDGVISYCSNAAAVSGCCAAGGITGGKKSVQTAVSTAASIVEYCRNTGEIRIAPGNDPSNLGGIAGNIYGKNSIVRNCVNTGRIVFEILQNSGDNNKNGRMLAGAGGIVGKLNTGTVENCYNRGTFEVNLPQYTSVVNPARFGGIVGLFSQGVTGAGAGINNANNPDPAFVTNCYSTGVFEMSDKSDCATFGALAGFCVKPELVTATGCVYPESLLFGRLIAAIFGVEDAPGHAESLSDEQMQLQESYTSRGWDFGSVWTMGAPYPQLINVPETIE